MRPKRDKKASSNQKGRIEQTPEPKILQSLQLRTPRSKEGPNLIFKMVLPEHPQPVYINYSSVARDYPQILLSYLAKCIVIKDKVQLEPSSQSSVKPIVDCDNHILFEQNKNDASKERKFACLKLKNQEEQAQSQQHIMKKTKKRKQIRKKNNNKKAKAISSNQSSPKQIQSSSFSLIDKLNLKNNSNSNDSSKQNIKQRLRTKPKIKLNPNYVYDQKSKQKQKESDQPQNKDKNQSQILARATPVSNKSGSKSLSKHLSPRSRSNFKKSEFEE